MSYNPNDPNTWQTPPPQGQPQGQPNYQNVPPPGYQQPPPGYQQMPPGGYQPYANAPGMQTDLPQANSAQICGIIGLVLFFNLIGLILNIVAMVQGGNAMRTYQQYPGRYTEASFRKAKAGRTCGIVGVSLFGFVILVIIIVIAANS